MKFKNVDYSKLGYDLSREFGDWDDEQPSYEDIMHGEAKSPPSLKGGYGRYGVFQMVGHGKQTRAKCGAFGMWIGCSRVELHNKTVFDGRGNLVDYHGKGHFRAVFNSCNRPSCPVCYERGWAVREATSVDFRLEQSAKRWGLVEHIIVGIPQKLWFSNDVNIDVKLRKLVYKVLKRLGVVGGVVIFHGFRYNNYWEARRSGGEIGWYWSPHFHVLGHILGGYSRCRHCKNRICERSADGYNYNKCDGFDARARKENAEGSGCIIKVKGKRKTVFGTAWYQLHHSSVRTDKKRYHVAHWFGVCSYRKLKLTKEMRKEYDDEHGVRCPICGSKLVRHGYSGKKKTVLVVFSKRRGSKELVKGFLDDACDWVELPKSRFS